MNRESLKLTAQVIASDTQELFDIAKSKGIAMPHPALGIFKSVLAEIEEPNSNGYRLAEKATKEAVSTLPGCQMNKNHSVRRDPKTLEFITDPMILGHAIDASINKDNLIEVVCIFYKYQYFEEWDEAQKLFEKNKLTMSFELSYDKESAEKLKDKTTRINDYYFTGAGLLFGVTPACKKAKVLEITAQKLQEKLSMERQGLIFANNQNSQKSIMEVLKLMADEVKKIEEPIVAEVVKTEAIIEAPKVEETIVAETPKAEASKVEEVKVDTDVEAKVDVPVVEEPKTEAAKVEESVKTTEIEKVAETNETVTQSIVVVQKEVVSTPDTTEVHTVVQEADKTTYPSGNSATHVITQETVEKWIWEQVQAMQAEHVKEVSELKAQLDAKEKEVATLQASQVVKEEVKVEAKAEEPVVLATGHKKVDASAEDSSSPIAKILKNKHSYRK
jgi:hypothetical protein